MAPLVVVSRTISPVQWLHLVGMSRTKYTVQWFHIWMVISTGVVEASSVEAGRCVYRICFQPSPLTSLTAKVSRVRKSRLSVHSLSQPNTSCCNLLEVSDGNWDIAVTGELGGGSRSNKGPQRCSVHDPPACGHALALTNPCPNYGSNSTAALR